MNFESLQYEWEGEFFTSEAIRRIYATDASAYREMPLAVAIPKTEMDIKRLVHFALANKTSLIPRAAGTSLAGQVVGNGIIVDISKYFNQILAINIEEGWVHVQPGIIRDDLNQVLAEHGCFFAPETSTSNCATIGGMIGNNSCGSNSIVYGSTREHLLEVKAILSDGSTAHFKANKNLRGHSTLEKSLYDSMTKILSNEDNVKRIRREFPNPTISRRNTGYALDMLADMKPFNATGEPFNFCSLIAGSEGTLAFVTEAKLKLTELPSKHKKIVCIHCDSIDKALRANLVALHYQPHACELIDHYILEAAKRNKNQSNNRFFVEGDPQVLLVVELIRDSEDAVDTLASGMIAELSKKGLGYAFPTVKGSDISKVWSLRKAGLGLLSNIPGDEKPVPVVEDTAVAVQELPEYIIDFNKILKKYGLYSVHYAHAGSGELHLRPIINLKKEKGVKLFRIIAEEIALLVKRYKGSLSGEHGDGRLRGEFIPHMIGLENYELLKKIKKIWDPHNLFNPGKIVDTAPMDRFLRYETGRKTREFETTLDFSENHGILRAAELCNGSGDCRKSKLSGGIMCPSYMVTKDEKDTTRARANILREFLSRSEKPNPFDHQEIREVMDLCLSCKGCKSECPSNVDVTKLKAEWQHQSQRDSGIPWRTKMVASYPKGMVLFEKFPQVYNAARNLTRPILGFSRKRSMPKMAKRSLRSWFRKQFHSLNQNPKKKVYFFFDEFTNYLDVQIGKKAIMLLDRLGYEVLEVSHPASGRTYLSKGMLNEGKKLAEENVRIFYHLLDPNTCLVGVEPSAILTFRDEYPDLLREEYHEYSKTVSQYTFTIEEFLAEELDRGNLTPTDFPRDHKKLIVHGHCHQKALSSMTPTLKVLSSPANYEVQMIPSGCCGMAGSFGYEKEHFDVSMKIGELILFPKIREAKKGTFIVASGTSCRHQILDGTGKRPFHPVEIL